MSPTAPKSKWAREINPPNWLTGQLLPLAPSSSSFHPMDHHRCPKCQVIFLRGSFHQLRPFPHFIRCRVIIISLLSGLLNIDDCTTPPSTLQLSRNYSFLITHLMAIRHSTRTVSATPINYPPLVAVAINMFTLNSLLLLLTSDHLWGEAQ